MKWILVVVVLVGDFNQPTALTEHATEEECRAASGALLRTFENANNAGGMRFYKKWGVACVKATSRIAREPKP